MTDEIERQVTASRPLNVRQSGNKDAEIVAQLPTDALVVLAGAENHAGYAPVVINGWLAPDGKAVLSDSLAEGVSNIDAVLLKASAWQASGDKDQYGRIPGAVRGWIWLGFTKPVEPAKE